MPNQPLQPNDSPLVTLKRIRKQYDRASITTKLECLNKALDLRLKHLDSCSYDTNHFKGNIENPIGICQVPSASSGHWL